VHLFRHARVRQIVRQTKSLPLAQRQAGWSRLQPAYLSIGDQEARDLMRGVTDGWLILSLSRPLALSTSVSCPVNSGPPPDAWPDLHERLLVGQVIERTLTWHAPFEISVDLGAPAHQASPSFPMRLYAAWLTSQPLVASLTCVLSRVPQDAI